MRCGTAPSTFLHLASSTKTENPIAHIASKIGSPHWERFMLGNMKKRVSKSLMSFGLAAVLVLTASMVQAQTAARFLGSVTAINGDTLTVKNAQGQEQQVQVPSTADLKRIEPGQTDLTKAVALQYSDLAVNDRVLIYLDPNATGGKAQATRLIAIKQADLAKQQQSEAAEWRNGASGLVKSVDAASGDIVIKSGAGPTEKTVTVHTGKTTILKRYAAASISYDKATVAPFDAIHAGDQLTARGTKNADGTEVTATEVVTGSFRNLDGTISSLDASNSTIEVKDLATKKQVTIHITADAQMHKLDARMAQMLAARLNGTTAGGARGGAGGGAPAAGGAGNAGGGGGRGAGGQGMGQGMDPQQLLNRAPAIHFADLQKGDAVMLVSTSGESDVTAITLMAGVEAILEAPAGKDVLSNWSMGGGEGGEE